MEPCPAAVTVTILSTVSWGNVLSPSLSRLALPPCPAAELMGENEGAALGSVLLETTTQGLRRLSAKALQAFGNWLSPGEPA